MIQFPTRKLWGGDVSVPSFLVQYAKKMHQQIKITHENAYMIIDGKTPYLITAPTQVAQHTDKYIKRGEYYSLYDYKWNPTIEVKDYTKEGLGKLHNAMSKIFKKKPLTLF